jgi:hypothetical protein
MEVTLPQQADAGRRETIRAIGKRFPRFFSSAVGGNWFLIPRVVIAVFPGLATSP